MPEDRKDTEMIRFESDYTEGAHPSIIRMLAETNMEQTIGYGEDPFCRKAAALMREKCGREDLDVHFLVGGTQTNLTVISAALRPHQGAVAVETGHINTHETGAIEATGHKVLAIPGRDGKLDAAGVQDLCDRHYADASREHTVQPKLVYISNPTEIGTIYSRAELEALSSVCRKNGLYFFLDGARLGYALAAVENDLDLPTIARLCDVFYFGGTKIGALFGEALVIRNEALKEDFRYQIKQKGGMLAKGRLLGIQFVGLLEDDRYLEICRHADEMAARIRQACEKKGYGFLIRSCTNQQFPILPDGLLSRIGLEFTYSFWEKTDAGHSAVRFCTSWATKEENVQKLVQAIEMS